MHVVALLRIAYWRTSWQYEHERHWSHASHGLNSALRSAPYRVRTASGLALPQLYSRHMLLSRFLSIESSLMNSQCWQVLVQPLVLPQCVPAAQAVGDSGTNSLLTPLTECHSCNHGGVIPRRTPVRGDNMKMPYLK